MAIRLSGLNSGMDTDSIVQALMSAQRTKQTKVEAKKTKLEWKKEIWGELNTKIYDFYKNTLAKIKMQSAYKTKAATSSDPSKVKATATTTASEGTCKIKVNSLASAQYVTSGKLAGAKVTDENGVTTVEKVTSKSKLTDLVDASGNTTFTKGTQLTVKGASGTSMILIDENTTIADFVSACKDVGLNASFDEQQQRFFIGSGSSGKDQGFTITSGGLTSAQMDAVNEWKNAVGYEYLSSEDKAAVSKIFNQLQTGETTFDKVSDSLNGYLEKSQEAAVTAYYKKNLTDDYNSQYFSDTDLTQVTADGEAALLASGKTQEEIDKLKQTDGELAKAVSELVTKKVSEDLVSDTYKAKIADGVTNGVSDTGTSDFLKKTAAERTSTLATAAQNYNATMSNIADNSSQLTGLGLSAVDGSKITEGSDANGTGMVVVEASDAEIVFNGATLTSSTSSMSVNGLTLDILDATAGQEITVSVTKDNSAVYDTIKDFLAEYNSVLKEMNTKYNAASAKGYDVLTDDQKEAMSDDEVEKWEDKIKGSLLRRDDTLSSLISSFRNNMMGNYTASDGKTYSLASLGISTSTDYSEGGLLHIKGDEDDTVYADEENKLEKMLNEDPDLVMEILTGITNNLYADLQKKSGSTTMSSIFTFYNDKEMNSQLSDYKEEIEKWETKLTDMENRYYSQFTAMEKAMAKLNSQQSYFSNM